MHEHYSLIVCIGVALVNLVLSVAIPALVARRNNDLSLMDNARVVFRTSKEIILTSTLIVLVTTYLAVEFKPTIERMSDNVDRVGLNVLRDLMPKRSSIKYLTQLH